MKGKHLSPHLCVGGFEQFAVGNDGNRLVGLIVTKISVGGVRHRRAGQFQQVFWRAARED